MTVVWYSWAVVHDLSIEQHYRVQEVLVIGIRFLFNDSTGKMVNIFRKIFGDSRISISSGKLPGSSRK